MKSLNKKTKYTYNYDQTITALKLTLLIVLLCSVLGNSITDEGSYCVYKILIGTVTIAGLAGSVLSFGCENSIVYGHTIGRLQTCKLIAWILDGWATAIIVVRVAPDVIYGDYKILGYAAVIILTFWIMHLISDGIMRFSYILCDNFE